MCNKQHLFKSSKAQAIRCSECKRIQLVFGHMLMILESYEFRKFCQVVDDKMNEWNVLPEFIEKKVILPTNADDIHLILTHFELKNLWYNIMEASAIIKYYDVLER